MDGAVNSWMDPLHEPSLDNHLTTPLVTPWSLQHAENNEHSNVPPKCQNNKLRGGQGTGKHSAKTRSGTTAPRRGAARWGVVPMLACLTCFGPMFVRPGATPDIRTCRNWQAGRTSATTNSKVPMPSTNTDGTYA